MDDLLFMKEALREAMKAERLGEVPVGAVVVHEGRIIARGYNKRESMNDPTAHAEIIAIKKASRRLKNWRLSGTTLYVTLEPCLMCMGAILQARIPRLVFASFDPKAGACGSLYDLSQDRRLNHRIEVCSGICDDEAGRLLREFFVKVRTTKEGEASCPQGGAFWQTS